MSWWEKKVFSDTGKVSASTRKSTLFFVPKQELQEVCSSFLWANQEPVYMLPTWPGAWTQECTDPLTIPFSFCPILPMLFLWGSDTAQVWPNCGDQSTKASQASGLRWRTCVWKRWPSPKCQLSRTTISSKMCVAVMWQTHYQKTQHLIWKA